ncbi:MAG: hypothetical protein JO182_32200 [Acidobacteriaceae bacterium]|nr:hypothetical protein [Acidobacteriaceae bacterium]MBV9039191.1 hypothetical protein [Acidobacteriaceae bacterium]MBV9222500.1 hypothetical protein [Acidobacteriaceae bacterium]MBV9308920.1 hypothetical protein [Acidobacteriaceae bacterium]MBV9675863.1 hypothetical protein [Acidobacteriaceae bacterium]
MLHQASHWTEIAGITVSAILLYRVLALRLYRVYLFITLACVLDLFFAGAMLWSGKGSQASDRISFYSSFIYAFVYPMVAWDVFEEMKTQVGKLRRLAIVRLISGLFFAVVFGLIMAASINSSNANGESAFTYTLALVLWAGSTTASFAFLLTIYRVLRTQPIVRPNNTNVWMYYYGLSFLSGVVFCFLWLAVPLAKSEAAREVAKDVLDIASTTFDIILTSWCILKLRAVASDLPSASENARL